MDSMLEISKIVTMVLVIEKTATKGGGGVRDVPVVFKLQGEGNHAGKSLSM
tara:strand:+ start:1033 stop:1185 length:153 start_codon:yes stop_codon:yes gene_type:complete